MFRSRDDPAGAGQVRVPAERVVELSMSVTTQLTDGGRVEAVWSDTSSAQVFLQKYDAAGARVGPEFATWFQNSTPEVLALPGGGYVLLASTVFRGSVHELDFFDAAGIRLATRNPPGSGLGYDLAASPLGGVAIVAMERGGSNPNGPDAYAWRPLLSLYDARGNVIAAGVPLSGDAPEVTLLSDGRLEVTWTDGSIAHRLDIDPRNPPDLSAPSVPSFTLLDDQGPATGVIPVGGRTTDATPVARVAVTEAGWLSVTQTLGGASEPAYRGGVAVTAEDAARGYVDVTLPQSEIGAGAGAYPETFWVRFKDANGITSEAASQGIVVDPSPEIWSVTDDAGPQTGAVARGGTTDDATPTVRVGLESSGLHAGDTLDVRDTGGQVGSVVLSAADLSRGYADVTTGPLADGTHDLRAGSSSLPAFTIVVQAADGPSGGGGASEPDFATARANILRPGSPSATAEKVAAGQMSGWAAVDALVDEAASTTAVATLSYAFFTGRTPSSAGLDYLVSPMGPNPNNLNSAYYQGFNIENRYINFAVNLGKMGEGAAAFASAYGGLTLFEATRTAYGEIFGAAPSDTKLHDLLDARITLGGATMTRADYFNVYGQDGPDGIGTKAAMVGWLLAEAEKAELGVYAHVNDAYLHDLADGAAYNIDIVGTYNRPDYAYHPG